MENCILMAGWMVSKGLGKCECGLEARGLRAAAECLWDGDDADADDDDDGKRKMFTMGQMVMIYTFFLLTLSSLRRCKQGAAMRTAYDMCVCTRYESVPRRGSPPEASCGYVLDFDDASSSSDPTSSSPVRTEVVIMTVDEQPALSTSEPQLGPAALGMGKRSSMQGEVRKEGLVARFSGAEPPCTLPSSIDDCMIILKWEVDRQQPAQRISSLAALHVYTHLLPSVPG